MSTTVLPFRVKWAGGIAAGDAPRLDIVEAESGIIRARLRDPTPRYEQPNALIILDGSAGHTYEDWRTWYASSSNAYYGAEPVLVRPELTALYRVTDEALGTCSTPGTDTFALDSRFVHHTNFSESASTLVVKVAGVIQTLTTDYTVSGNGTAPLVTTTAAFDTGTVTASYERYFQCYVFTIPGSVPAVARLDTGQGMADVVSVPVRIVERTPGGHLV